MNHHDIQRAVRAKRIDRTLGDAPSLGRLARAPGTGLRKLIRRGRRHGAGTRRKRSRRRRVIVVWSVVLVVVTIGVLSIAVWLWLLFGMDHDGADVSEHAATPGVQERVISRFKSPSQSAALDLVKQALKVSDPDKVEEFFHLGSANPGVVVDFLRNMEALDGAIIGYHWLSSMDVNNLLIDGVAVNTLLRDKPHNRLALLMPNEKGHWKIDFDAFARTVNPSWNELLAMKSGQGLVRVVIAQDSYYNGIFSDDKEWVCYGMASPDLEVNLFGYCRRRSPQAVAMERLGFTEQVISDNNNLKRATLEIRRTAGAGDRQFEITRVMAEDWVMSATPFDENFK
ncbi:MAG: hypothetical protein NTV46_10395 [Verrucomicrobia bacterium]|nr:hypothetical protein [Verrucomicrobiota bacterium]